MAHSTIMYTTGSPGAGKTYRRCGYFLVEEFFSDEMDPDAHYYTNMDIKFDPWVNERGQECRGLCELVEKRWGIDREEVLAHIHVFPDEYPCHRKSPTDP